MSALSDVTCVLAQRAADIEHARGIFTAEVRAFSTAILDGVRRVSAQPWMNGRIRLDLPREVTTELKAASYFSSQYALAGAIVRFKKGTKYRAIADLIFGVEYEAQEGIDAFVWNVKMIPNSNYLRLDDLVWEHWKRTRGPDLPPGAAHRERVNVLRFALRPVIAALTIEQAVQDVKQTLEYLLTADEPLGRAVGFAAAPDDDDDSSAEVP
jgi:hypothetical protein